MNQRKVSKPRGPSAVDGTVHDAAGIIAQQIAVAVAREPGVVLKMTDLLVKGHRKKRPE